MNYRGRLAPTPTGFLHAGHASTFYCAWKRCQEKGGVLVLRNEDLDNHRTRKDFIDAMFEDLHWLGFHWDEGPDIGGPFSPYNQSERIQHYFETFQKLKSLGTLYPCNQSRKDVLRSISAPHAGDEEPVYPGTCRPGKPGALSPGQLDLCVRQGAPINWRFLVPDGLTVSFVDLFLGPQEFIGGRDFGDFIVWRHEQTPSYQLAVVVDDHLMQISEVVRGKDLLVSTARQILLYQALGWPIPSFVHCQLVLDASGKRLAKRHQSLSLRSLREEGWTPDDIKNEFFRCLPSTKQEPN